MRTALKSGRASDQQHWGRSGSSRHIEEPCTRARAWIRRRSCWAATRCVAFSANSTIGRPAQFGHVQYGSRQNPRRFSRVRRNHHRRAAGTWHPNPGRTDWRPRGAPRRPASRRRAGARSAPADHAAEEIGRILKMMITFPASEQSTLGPARQTRPRPDAQRRRRSRTPAPCFVRAGAWAARTTVHRTTRERQVEPRRREAPDDAAAARLTRTVYEPGQIERSATRSGARTRPRTVRGRREALCETWGALGVVSEARDPDEAGVSERTRTPAFS